MAATRSIFAALVLAALAAAPAGAQPGVRFTIYDPILVGNASGTPIGGVPAGFDVDVRDVNNAPIPGGIVTLDFSAVTMRLASVQSPGTTLNCAARTLSRVTAVNGKVNFAARLGGFVNSNAVLLHIPDGGPPIPVKARSTDIDGVDGKTGLNDFTLFSANFLGNQPAQETDFDLNGMTALGDFVLFTVEFLGNATNAYCP